MANSRLGFPSLRRRTSRPPSGSLKTTSPSLWATTIRVGAGVAQECHGGGASRIPHRPDDRPGVDVDEPDVMAEGGADGDGDMPAGGHDAERTGRGVIDRPHRLARGCVPNPDRPVDAGHDSPAVFGESGRIEAEPGPADGPEPISPGRPVPEVQPPVVLGRHDRLPVGGEGQRRHPPAVGERLHDSACGRVINPDLTPVPPTAKDDPSGA